MCEGQSTSSTRPAKLRDTRRPRWRHLGKFIAGAVVLLCTATAVLAYQSAGRKPGGLMASRGAAHGSLAFQRITIAPVVWALSEVEAGPLEGAWFFPGSTAGELAEFLSHAQLSAPQFESVLGGLERQPLIGGFVARPEPDLVRSLSPRSRALIYNRLAQDPLNLAMINAFRFCGGSIDDWFAGAGLSPRTLDLVRPLVYRNGELLFFADTRLVLPQIEDVQERTRLIQALARESTLLVWLQVREGQDVEPLVEYWGQGGRAKDIRPLLQSLARNRGGGRIDIAHLLPPFARQRLYTYPLAEPSLPAGQSRDCHWTAHNFFNTVPDDRFADAAYVALALAEYQEVEEPGFGDLVAYVSQGQVFHTAVYIAADIVFTRNGARFSRPWMLMPLSGMDDFYPRTAPVQVHYLRRTAASSLPPTPVPPSESQVHP